MKATVTRHKLSLRRFQAPAWRVPLRRKAAVARRDPDLGRFWRGVSRPGPRAEDPCVLADLLVTWVRRQRGTRPRSARRWERRAA